MMTFRKLSAASVGKMLMRYFTEHTPQPTHDFSVDPGKVRDNGDQLTSYYTGRDGRATWRPDMAASAAKALGIDHRSMPKDDDLSRLFEAKRGDNGLPWSEQSPPSAAHCCVKHSRYGISDRRERDPYFKHCSHPICFCIGRCICVWLTSFLMCARWSAD